MITSQIPQSDLLKSKAYPVQPFADTIACPKSLLSSLKSLCLLLDQNNDVERASALANTIEKQVQELSINRRLTTLSLEESMNFHDVGKITSFLRFKVNRIMRTNNEEALYGLKLILALAVEILENVSGMPKSTSFDIREVLELVKRSEAPNCEDISFNLTVPSVPSTVFADRVGIYRTILNICVNANQAICHATRLTNQLNKKNKIDVTAENKFEDVLITISDTGPGIPSDILPKIFDCGFTTKKDNDGTGLGLHIAKQKIESMGGKITVSSELGIGTVFKISLPLLKN